MTAPFFRHTTFFFHFKSLKKFKDHRNSCHWMKAPAKDVECYQMETHIMDLRKRRERQT